MATRQLGGRTCTAGPLCAADAVRSVAKTSRMAVPDPALNLLRKFAGHSILGSTMPGGFLADSEDQGHSKA